MRILELMEYIHDDIYLNRRFRSFLYCMYSLRECRNVHDRRLECLHCHRDLQYEHNEMLMRSEEKRMMIGGIARKINRTFSSSSSKRKTF